MLKRGSTRVSKMCLNRAEERLVKFCNLAERDASRIPGANHRARII